MQFHPRLAQNAVNSMQLWRTARLQIRSDALAGAAELSLSTAPRCRHVIVSDCDEQQRCQICMTGARMSLSSTRHEGL